MRIVKLSELNEEDKKEYERQRAIREQQSVAEKESEIQRVNELLNSTNISDNTKNINNRQLGNRNGFTARTAFYNNDRVKNAKVVKDENNSFENFSKKIAQNPNQVASILTDVGSSIYSGRINAGQGGENLLAENFREGIMENATGLSSLAVNPIAEGIKKVGQLTNNKELYNYGNTWQNTMKAISEINSFGSKTSSKLNDGIYRTANSVSRTLGNMAPSIALSGLTGGASAVAGAADKVDKIGKVGTFLAKNSGGLLQAANVAGNEMTQTLNEDNSNFGKAATTGLLKGTVEYATEKLFGGNILATNTSIDNLVTKGISRGLKSKIAQKAASKAYEYTGEIVEEIISDTAGNFIDNIVNGKELPSLKEWWENSKETAKDTFLTTAVLQALGLGGGTYQEVKELNLNRQQEAEMNKWVNKAKEIINESNNIKENNKKIIDTLSRNGTFENQLEMYKNGQMKSSDTLYLGQTPEIYLKLGLSDNPITLLQRDLKKITTDGIDERSHEHGISIDTLKNLPKALGSPLNILKSVDRNGNNSIVVITDLADSNQKPIIASILIDDKGQIGNIHFDTNRLTSAYGKNNYDDYMKRQIEAGNMLYDIDEGIIKESPSSTGLQLPKGLDSSVDNNNDLSTNNNIIPYSSQNINENKNVMQKNNSKPDIYIRKRTNSFVNKLVNDMQLSKYANKEVLNEALNSLVNNISNNTLTDEIKTEIFNDLYSRLKTRDTSYYEQYKGLKNDIKNTKLYISDNIKNGITDFNSFKSNNFGTLNLTSDNSALPVDTFYKELNEIYGEGLFPNTINTQEEQLQRISEIAKDIKIVERNISNTDMSEDYKKWAKNDFDKAVDILANDIKQVNKYKEEKSQTNTYNISKEEYKELTKNLANYKREAERVSNKELLTKKDKVQVDRLLKGEIGLNELPNDVNKKGIANVYKAKLPYYEVQKAISDYRKNVKTQYRELARQNIENIVNWKDKSNGFKYQRETMERNMFDIIPDKQEAQRMIDTYFTPVHEAEANKQRFINEYNDKIKALNLNKYESEAVQLLGEQKYNPDFKADDVKPVLDRVNENIQRGKIDRTKVDNAIETFRNLYDELFELENKTLTENGYEPKPYRKGYFPHFIDAVPTTKVERALDKLGFKIDKRALPTDIAGITEQFVPGKTWNRSALERKTDRTDYNALKGWDTYIAQAADNIFHTENIQKLRALENEIRYQYSDKGVQERIDNIYNDESLTVEEQQAEIDKVFEQLDNSMPNLVVELRRYTNNLANKKLESDRSSETEWGRKIYSTVNAIENRFGANAVGLNIGSAVTNFIPITQAYSQVSTKNMTRAIIDTVKSYIQDDGFANKSTFLTNRLNQSEKLYKTTLEKISDKTSFLFNAVDSVASNIVVRGKYLENIDSGMTEAEAMKNANTFGANLMADRSKGAMPTRFNAKSPLKTAFNQFQLEVNNQYSYMFKDLPRDMKDKGLGSIALAFFKMFVAAFFYNKASEEITGRKAAFSPIDIAVDSYKTMSDDKMSTADKVLSVGKDVAEELPFVGGFLGGGRIPVSGALPDAENTFKASVGLATGEMDSKKALSTLGKELSKPAYYLLPPFGGGQLKKTVEGLSTVAKGGSYGIDSKGNDTLQFPVENANVGDAVKAGIFGKYALPLAKEYAERGYKSLTAKQTQGYENAKLPYKDFLNYIDAGLTKTEDKIEYINKQDLTDEQKWQMYRYNVFSTTERTDGTTQLMDADFAISSKISTQKEYMEIFNKAKENDINMLTSTEMWKLKEQGISLKNYIDYKVNLKETTNTLKADGTLKKDGTLSTKDKINELLKFKCSDEEKQAIYSNYVNTQDDKVDLVVESGIKIKDYLNFKTQSFETEKDEDGNTIVSKKRKVFDYLNSVNLNVSQKAILLKLAGYSDYNDAVIKYVTGSELSVTKQKELLEALGFKVNNDGKITTK